MFVCLFFLLFYKEYLANVNFTSSFFFEPVISADIELEISLLPSNIAYGLYSCPVRVLKCAKNIISPPLAELINLSVQTGKYPSKLKHAKIIPVYKGDDETDPSNYRPISLLSVFNRIFEKTMYNRLKTYIEDNELLYEAQYGFREKFSTQHAILDIVDTIQTNMDKKMFTCGIFLDFKKAFDTVTHVILLDKLHYYGVRGIVHEWFSSYLANRTQTTHIDNDHISSHIDHIASKISKIVGILARIRHHVPFNILLQIYRSLIFPYTLYGIPVWGQAAQRDLEKILILQKRALRLIFFSNNRTHAIPLFITSNILPVNMLYFETVSAIMHDVSTTGSTPCNIRQLFIHSSDVHAHNTRSSSTKNFFIQESRLRVKLKSFSAFGARLWNCLHPDWRKLTKRAFKRKLHKLLLTILGIEDYYVDAHSLILKINANNYCTL